MKRPNDNISRASILENALLAHFTSSISHESLLDAVQGLGRLKVLVIGDAIFDRYAYVNVQGLTSKNRIISGRYLYEETQCGGAIAVFAQVKQFARQVKILSLVGREDWVDSELRTVVSEAEDCIVRDPSFTTIVKQRFVEPLVDGAEVSKLFAVNFIGTNPPAALVQAKIESAIRKEIANVDVVLLADFGHGLMQRQIRELVQESAPFIALNCQTNSYNQGFNIISRQYQRVDAFTLDERELILAVGNPDMDFGYELAKLKRSLAASYAWLTRGAVETIGLGVEDLACACPPLERDIVDTIGAGDAFFAVAALAAAQKLPIELATLLGQLAGAQAVRIVGNSRPISKDILLETARFVLDSTRHADMY